MSGVLAVVLAAAAVAVAVPSGAVARRARLARLLPRGAGATQRDRGDRGDRWSALAGPRTAAIFAGFSGAIVVGGAAGVVLGVIVAVTCEHVLRRLEPGESRRRRRRLSADLPVAADLMAGCLLAGTTLDEAAESVAFAIGGPLEGVLLGVVASVRLGAEPSGVWLSVAEEQCLAPLARTVARTVSSGAPVAEAMARLADDQRAARRRSAAAAAGRVGVRAAMPLGLCFLPAFVLIGVVPVVGGITSRVLGG